MYIEFSLDAPDSSGQFSFSSIQLTSFLVYDHIYTFGSSPVDTQLPLTPSVDDSAEVRSSFLAALQFSTSGREYSSAGVVGHGVASSSKYEELIVFLGIFQRLGIKYMSTSWLPAMDVVGRGGSAEIRQSLAVIQTSFAFKRLTQKATLMPLIAELQILGHPAIQKHPNIIMLEGISWDVDASSGEAWPVLVFHKAHFRDLKHFMMTASRGLLMSVEDKLEMLADIASAVQTMHANGGWPFRILVIK